MDDHTIIIGAGIVGLATAWEIVQKKPNAKITILEKEREVAFHQTGHNSGVLHTGIYYKPNSLKALNCRSGKLLMEKFCAEYEIPHEICGKVIVATKQSEIPSLNKIYQRGLANGVACEKIDRAQLLKIEPNCAGIEAIHVPEAGIVNYKEVCNKLISLILEKEQNEIYYHSKVVKIRTHNKQVVVETNNKDFTAQRLINCGGLYSDHLTQLSGQKVQAKIIPFRGEYFEVKANAKDLCRNLIYPVPEPSFPFLGVHFTRMIDGSLECGPNAVLAFAREGYGKLEVNFAELMETLFYSGFQSLARKYWKIGAGEMWRSFSKAAFVKALQKLIPDIREEHLVPVQGGIRAQAVFPNGEMVDDFLVLKNKHGVHVCNAPSPAATSSLSIGKHIVHQMED